MAITKKSLISKNSTKKSTKKSSPKAPAITAAKMATTLRYARAANGVTAKMMY